MGINRSFFFQQTRATLFAGRLAEGQTRGMAAILDRWEQAHASADDRWLAYMLATVHHETDKKFAGIREYGHGRGKPYGRPVPPHGHVYYGRGFVQLTWKENYQKMSPVCGADLVANPDLALELSHCVRILFHGMIHGSFTGRKLADYFNPARENWVEARRIINGLDKAHLIADHARRFYAAISYTTG